MEIGNTVLITDEEYKGRQGTVMDIRDGWMHQQYEVLLDDNKTYCYPYHDEVEKIGN